MIDSKPSAILFDWDGTLVDSLPFLHRAHGHVFTAMGLTPWTLDEARLKIRHSTREMYPTLFGDRAAEATRILYDYVDAHHLAHIVRMREADTVLAALHRAGYKMGVVSNKGHARLVAEIAALGWGDYFQAVIGAGEAARDKPAPDPLLMALGKMGLGPQNVWYVGDTEIDVQCAREAGCVPVFIAHGMATIAEIQPMEPAIIFDHLTALRTAAGA